MLRYFRYINTLGFIIYPPHFVILSQINSEVFSSARGFFPQGFPRKSCVFPYICIFFIVPLIITSVSESLGFFDFINGNHEIRNSLIRSQYQIFVVAS